MGLFDRLSTLLRSNINDLISRAENPEKMLNQLIVDMKTNLAKAKQQVASAIADEKKLQADAENMKKQAEDWERRAMLERLFADFDEARAVLQGAGAPPRNVVAISAERRWGLDLLRQRIQDALDGDLDGEHEPLSALMRSAV